MEAISTLFLMMAVILFVSAVAVPMVFKMDRRTALYILFSGWLCLIIGIVIK